MVYINCYGLEFRVMVSAAMAGGSDSTSPNDASGFAGKGVAL
jgi:hypothetical protein